MAVFNGKNKIVVYSESVFDWSIITQLLMDS